MHIECLVYKQCSVSAVIAVTCRKGWFGTLPSVKIPEVLALNLNLYRDHQTQAAEMNSTLLEQLVNSRSKGTRKRAHNGLLGFQANERLHMQDPNSRLGRANLLSKNSTANFRITRMRPPSRRCGRQCDPKEANQGAVALGQFYIMITLMQKNKHVPEELL